MASTVSVTYSSQLTVTETLASGDAPAAAAAGRVITHNQFNTTLSGYNAGSAIPCDEVAGFTVALAAGTGTIDLTALDGVAGTINGTGLKLQFIKIIADSGNSAAVTLARGASNGYEFVSGAAWSIGLPPGAELLLNLNERAVDVASGKKIIDLTGTGTDQISVLAVIG